MVLGGVLALLIAHVFGKSTRTDAFFAAYGVYSVALVLGQTFRLAALPRLVADADGRSATRLLASVGLLALIAAVPMVALADPIGTLLVERDPDEVAAAALRALWPATVGQLLAAMLAAALAIRGRFVVIGVGYVIAGVASIVLFVALEQPLGIQAVPVALAGSGALLASLFATALLRTGWRPRAAQLRPAGVAGEAVRLVAASAIFLAANVGYIICVAVASRAGSGEATIYAYAYLSAALLVGATASSFAMVRSPKLLSAASSATRSAAHALTSYRFTLVLVLPSLALAAVAGPAILDVLLGGAFDRDDARRLVIALFCLSGWLLGSAGAVYAIVELLNQRRLAALAIVAAAQTAALLPLAILGRELAGIAGIALAQSSVMLAATGALTALAFESGARDVLIRLGQSTALAVLALAGSLVPGVGVLIVFGDSTRPSLVAAAVTIGALAIALRAIWPDEVGVLLSVVRRSAEPSAEARNADC